jgi:conjugative transposon TraM protein
MKIDNKRKRNLLLVQGCTLFFFLGFSALFYMLGGGTQTLRSAESHTFNMDTFPDAMVDKIPNDRLEAFKQATHLLKQEKEMDEMNNSFLFLEDDERNVDVENPDTALDEKIFDALKEIVVGPADDPIVQNREQIAQRKPQRCSQRSSKIVVSEEMNEEDWEEKMQAEIAERERRLQELYYGKKMDNSSENTRTKDNSEEGELQEKNLVESQPMQQKNGFRTLGGSSSPMVVKGRIRAVIHGEQKNVTESSQIKLRILDPIVIENFTIPRNTIIFGMASFSENRVNIDIENIAFENNIYPFRGRIYDQDGFLGIYIPDNLVNDAKTEASSETVSSADINFNGLTGIVSSGANAIVNATKNVVNGSIRRTKVTLPANYKLIIKTDERD